MADPTSLTAAVVQISDAAFGIAKFIKRCHDAPKDAKKFSEVLESKASILAVLEENVRNMSPSTGAYQEVKKASKKIKEIIRFFWKKASGLLGLEDNPAKKHRKYKFWELVEIFANAMQNFQDRVVWVGWNFERKKLSELKNCFSDLHMVHNSVCLRQLNSKLTDIEGKIEAKSEEKGKDKEEADFEQQDNEGTAPAKPSVLGHFGTGLCGVALEGAAVGGVVGVAFGGPGGVFVGAVVGTVTGAIIGVCKGFYSWYRP